MLFALGSVPAAGASAWEGLAALTPEERLAARIDLQALGTARGPSEDLRRIEVLWNESALHQVALARLRRLESQGVSMVAGISWRRPRAASPEVDGLDARIGSSPPRTQGRRLVLGYDVPSGNSFAVVIWDSRMTFNISTDGGASWAETYSLLFGVVDTDLTLAGDWVYVGYVLSSGTGEAWLRRFRDTDGTLDIVYSGRAVTDVSPEDLIDIALESDRDGADSRVFYAMVLTGGNLKFFWDEASDGLSFEEVSMPASNSVGGLDMHWNTSPDLYPLFLSHVGLDGQVHVLRYTETPALAWSQATSYPFDVASQIRTAISAYDETVVVAQQDVLTNGAGITYAISQNAGDTWSLQTLVAPTPGEGDFWDVDVTARGGAGLAFTYNLEAGAEDPAFFQFRPGYQSGPFQSRRRFNDFDAVTGRFTAITWLGAGRWGLGYLGIDNSRLAYFDTAREPLFADGFESNDASAWSATIP